MRFDSEGQFVDVVLTDGTVIEEVIVCGVPGGDGSEILFEHYNGDTETLAKDRISRFI